MTMPSRTRLDIKQAACVFTQARVPVASLHLSSTSTPFTARW